MKRDADPIALANREFWRRVRSDESYRRWMITRTRDLIAICEWPERREELRKVLKELEAMDGR